MLPAKIRVKLLSEAAGYISVAHVVQKDFTAPELLELLLAVVGKDAGRIQQILRTGTISTGDYRYRWEPLEIEDADLDVLLQNLPGPDPSRIFQPDSCFLVRFRRGPETLDFSKERTARKPLFARQSFWDALADLFRTSVRYADYSYADKADVFAVGLGADGVKTLQSLLPLLRTKGAAERLERLKPERIEWLARR